MESEFSQDHQPAVSFSDDAIQDMLVLARRLREQTGGDLDDSAILAVAEATGAPVDYIRLALQAVPEERQRQTIFERIKKSFLGIDPNARRNLVASVIACAMGYFLAMQNLTSEPSGFLSLLAMLLGGAGIWNAAVAKDAKGGALAGGIVGGGAFLGFSMFQFLFNMVPGIRLEGTGAIGIIFTTIIGACVGALANIILNANRGRIGMKDPVAERHDLLNQLLQIQDKLKGDEQFASFLSVDIVGSTKIKSGEDPLAVEFTFNEYHRYVDTICRKYGGRVHSTAGDGVTCYFDRPDLALAAGKALLGGLFEFNAFRNRLSSEIHLRAGIHCGSVLAPGRDLGSVNFAHVIDIASHLQKVTPVGTLAISEHAAAYVPGGRDSIGTEPIQSHDIKGVVWRTATRINPDVVKLMPQ